MTKSDRSPWAGKFAATTTAAALVISGSCEQRTPAPNTTSQSANAAAPIKGPDLFSVLSKPLDNAQAGAFKWMGADGKEVNMKALEAELSGKYKTLSFGFQGCQLMCPAINQNLKAVGDMNPDMVSIIVSVDPQNDGKDQASRDAMMRHFLEEEKLKQKVIVLFPVKEIANGKPVFAPENMIETQINAGSIINRDEQLAHTPYVFLYNPNHQLIGKELGTRGAGDFAGWKDLMQAGKGKK